MENDMQMSSLGLYMCTNIISKYK